MAAPTVAVIAAGQMGAAIGRRLADRGAAVLTSLAGRSKATVARAQASSMADAGDERIATADIILSIVPPADAAGLAMRLAPALTAVAIKPVYVDCNAVSPDTVAGIAAIVRPSGCAFVDGGILGGPPAPGYGGPALYVSGTAAPAVALLRDYGLDIRVLDGPVGAASALKMSYAGISKGLTAIASAMILAATRADAGPDLRRELADSQTTLLRRFARGIPEMFPKAYRWGPEMREIAGFLSADPAAQKIFEGAAELYDRLATDGAADGEEIAMLTAFLAEGRN